MKILPPAIFLMGPTASGKTDLTVSLHQKLQEKNIPIEVISVDSALIYRGMNIGTAKPSSEVLAETPHHLIDICTPTQTFSVAEFQSTARQIMDVAISQNKIPLLVGGTMLYFHALQYGLNDLPKANSLIRKEIDLKAEKLGWKALYTELKKIDPKTADRLQETDVQRIQRALEVYYATGKPLSYFHHKTPATLPYHLLKISLEPSSRLILHQYIVERFEKMLAQGLIEELETLQLQYPGLNLDFPSMRCVGYRQTYLYRQGLLNKEELKLRGIYATRQLAKRQLTWLRGMKDIIRIDCLSAHKEQEILALILQFIEKSYFLSGA